jgi:hypothetical protein
MGSGVLALHGIKVGRLIRSLPLTQPPGLPIYVAASRLAPFNEPIRAGLAIVGDCGQSPLPRRGRGDEFLEPRIILERIEHGIESKQRRSKRNAKRD